MVSYPDRPIPLERIPQVVQDEIRDFELQMNRMLRGERPEDDFKRYRLVRGIYGQRQKPNLQMIRVKVPHGRLNSLQLRTLAEVADRFATGVAHLTTRQNVQFHFVPLKAVPEVLWALAQAGLTTREACGNSIRNVTGCPLAGVCPSEVFDVTPYARAITDHFLRKEISWTLPRKFKIALSGCSDDCVQTWMNDVGLGARVRTEGGRPVRGFRVVVAGGFGPTPEVAHPFREFVPVEGVIPLIAAILRVFHRDGERKDKNRARLKFLLRRLGEGELFRRIEEELARDSAPVPIEAPEESVPPPPAAEPSAVEASAELGAWLDANVVGQRQSGYAAAHVLLPLGDATSEQLRVLADLADRFAQGEVRVTVRQNFVLRWVPIPRLPSLWEGLGAAGLDRPGAEAPSDVTSCPGADTCNLGITSSRGLARQIRALLEMGSGGTDDLEGLTVKISGCPNSCGQHHAAAVGFFGMVRRVGDRVVPTYQMLLGGGGGSMGRPVFKLPARWVPTAVRRLIDLYRAGRAPAETFPAFVRRVPPAEVQKALADLAVPGATPLDASLFQDWGEAGAFRGAIGGPGECAA